MPNPILQYAPRGWRSTGAGRAGRLRRWGSNGARRAGASGYRQMAASGSDVEHPAGGGHLNEDVVVEGEGVVDEAHAGGVVAAGGVVGGGITHSKSHAGQVRPGAIAPQDGGGVVDGLQVVSSVRWQWVTWHLCGWCPPQRCVSYARGPLEVDRST